MIAQALLLWLMAYLGVFAAVGFVLFMIRGASSRDWTNAALLRTSSLIAFAIATVFWLALILAD